MGWQLSPLFVLGISAGTFQEGICLHLEIMFLHLKQHLQDAEALGSDMDFSHSLRKPA